MKNAANVILDEKPNVHELTKGTLVLGEDLYSPGVIREENIELVGASFCMIKTNNETWFVIKDVVPIVNRTKLEE